MKTETLAEFETITSDPSVVALQVVLPGLVEPDGLEIRHVPLPARAPARCS